MNLRLLMERFKMDKQECPDCGEIVLDTMDYHSLRCVGRDDYDIEVIEGENGKKQVLLHRKTRNNQS